jgi:hypothetical protein
MRDYYNLVWCNPENSVNVDTAQVLALGTTNLREGDGWRKLAEMPICTDCHARLDYGGQFFRGFITKRLGTLFVPAEQLTGAGPFYARNISDRRGEGPLTPAGFGKLAVAQPEFEACMVRDVVNYVFNGAVSPAEQRVLRSSFAQGHSTRKLMRAALLTFAEQYLRGKVFDPVHPINGHSTARQSASTSDSRVVDIPPSLQGQLEQHCGGCHDEGPLGFLSQTQLPRDQLLKMLSAVAFRSMPKTTYGLEDSERYALVSRFIEVLYADASARAEATAYFWGGFRPLPARLGDTTLNLMYSRVGEAAPGPAKWHGGVPVRVGVRIAPSYIATAAREALAACKASKRQASELEQCLRKTLAPDGIIGGSGVRRR